jgi:hypothetical protein
VPLTAAETTTDYGFVALIDAAGAEWCNDGIAFKTVGHPSAADPQGCILSDAVGSATGQSTTNIRLSGAPATAPKPGHYFEVVSGTAIGNCGRVKTYTAAGTYDVVPYDALTIALGADSVVKFYRDSTLDPARVVAQENIDFGALQKTSLDTIGDTVATNYDAATGTEIAEVLAKCLVGVKKNTAKAGFPFVMRDSSTHLPKTGLTVTCTRSIDGGAYAAAATAGATEVASGSYKHNWAASDLNGDTIIFRYIAAGADDLFVTVMTEV